jgi:hypothetical protein
MVWAARVEAEVVEHAWGRSVARMLASWLHELQLK